MAFDTVIQQGRFTSDGTAKTLTVRSDIDWMEVINYTVADDDTQTTAVGVAYFWQRGMAADTGIEYKKSNAANAAQLTTALASGGFTLEDTSDNPVQAAVAVTSTTNATQPVVATGDTSGLVAGDIVRLVNITSAANLGGIDFQIDNISASTSFRIANALANAPGAGTTGFYRKIANQANYVPRRRFIANVTQASSAVVTTTVDHGYTVGEKVRFVVSSPYDMTELDGLNGTITATTTSTITVDIDTSSFTAFAFPVNGDVPFTPAQVIPFGENVAEARDSGVDELADSTDNVALIGMVLAAGTDSPAGSTSDVIYWRAGKSFSVNNE